MLEAEVNAEKILGEVPNAIFYESYHISQYSCNKHQTTPLN